MRHDSLSVGSGAVVAFILMRENFNRRLSFTVPDNLGECLGLAAPVQEAGEVGAEGGVGAVRVLLLVLLNGTANAVCGHDCNAWPYVLAGARLCRLVEGRKARAQDDRRDGFGFQRAVIEAACVVDGEGGAGCESLWSA